MLNSPKLSLGTLLRTFDVEGSGRALLVLVEAAEGARPSFEALASVDRPRSGATSPPAPES